MGGAVARREENAFARRPREIRITSRAFLRPFESGMILRGLRTLPQRMAEFVARHPAVTAEHSPGLPHHLGHAIAARRMMAFKGLRSLRV